MYGIDDLIKRIDFAFAEFAEEEPPEWLRRKVARHIGITIGELSGAEWWAVNDAEGR